MHSRRHDILRTCSLQLRNHVYDHAIRPTIYSYVLKENITSLICFLIWLSWMRMICHLIMNASCCFVAVGINTFTRRKGKVCGARPVPLRSARHGLSGGANSSCLFHFLQMVAHKSSDFTHTSAILRNVQRSVSPPGFSSMRLNFTIMQHS